MYNGDMFDPRTAPFQRDMAKGLTWFRQPIIQRHIWYY